MPSAQGLRGSASLVIVPSVCHGTPGHARPDGGHDEPVPIAELALLERDRNRGGSDVAGVRVCDDELFDTESEALSDSVQDAARCLVGNHPRDVLEGQARALHRLRGTERGAINRPGIDLRKHEAQVVKTLIEHLLIERSLATAARDMDILAQVPVRSGDEGSNTVTRVRW